MLFRFRAKRQSPTFRNIHAATLIKKRNEPDPDDEEKAGLTSNAFGDMIFHYERRLRATQGQNTPHFKLVAHATITHECFEMWGFASLREIEIAWRQSGSRLFLSQRNNNHTVSERSVNALCEKTDKLPNRLEDENV